MPTPQQVANIYKVSSHQLDKNIHLLDKYDVSENSQKNSNKGSHKLSFEKVLDQKLKKNS